MARTKFSQNGNAVSLTFENDMFEIETRNFWLRGEAVMEGDQQVCGNLSHRGGTLYSTPADFLALIKREWRRSRAVARKERAAW